MAITKQTPLEKTKESIGDDDIIFVVNKRVSLKQVHMYFLGYRIGHPEKEYGLKYAQTQNLPSTIQRHLFRRKNIVVFDISKSPYAEPISGWEYIASQLPPKATKWDRPIQSVLTVDSWDALFDKVVEIGCTHESSSGEIAKALRQFLHINNRKLTGAISRILALFFEVLNRSNYPYQLKAGGSKNV